MQKPLSLDLIVGCVLCSACLFLWSCRTWWWITICQFTLCNSFFFLFFLHSQKEASLLNETKVCHNLVFRNRIMELYEPSVFFCCCWRNMLSWLIWIGAGTGALLYRQNDWDTRLLDLDKVRMEESTHLSFRKQLPNPFNGVRPGLSSASTPNPSSLEDLPLCTGRPVMLEHKWPSSKHKAGSTVYHCSTESKAS